VYWPNPAIRPLTKVIYDRDLLLGCGSAAFLYSPIIIPGVALTRCVVAIIRSEKRPAMATIVEGIVFICLCVMLTSGCVVAVRRIVSHETLAAHNDVAGFVYATTGVTYAVILAFVVIAVWEGYNSAKQISDEEANSLGVMIRLANGFPEPARQDVQQGALAYAQAAVEEEWPAMAHRKAPSPETSAALDHLFQVYERPDIVASVNATQYQESLSELSDVSAARRERIVASQGGLPSIMWVVLAAGATSLVGLAFLFGVEDMRSQLAILSGLVIVVSLMLFVVYALNDPFTGGVRVHPDALELVLRQFGSLPATSVSTIQRSAQPTH